MEPQPKCKFWIEWRSWALPLRIAAFGTTARFELQIGPIGMTLHD